MPVILVLCHLLRFLIISVDVCHHICTQNPHMDWPNNFNIVVGFSATHVMWPTEIYLKLTSSSVDYGEFVCRLWALNRHIWHWLITIPSQYMFLPGAENLFARQTMPYKLWAWQLLECLARTDPISNRLSHVIQTTHQFSLRQIIGHSRIKPFAR